MKESTVSNMVKEVKEQNQKDIELLIKNYQINNRRNQIKSQQLDEFNKKKLLKEERFKNAKQISDSKEIERILKIKEKLLNNFNRTIHQSFHTIKPDNHVQVEHSYRNVLAQNESLRLTYANEINNKLNLYLTKRLNHLNELKNLSFSHNENVKTHYKNFLEENKYGTEGLKLYLDIENAKKFENISKMLKIKQNHYNYHDSYLKKYFKSANKLYNDFLQNDKLLYERVNDLKIKDKLENLYYNEDRYKRELKPNVLYNKKNRERVLNNIKNKQINDSEIKNKTDKDILNHEFIKFKKINNFERNCLKSQQDHIIKTVRANEFIDNKLDALTKQMEKLKNNTLYKPNYLKRIQNDLY